MCFRPPCQTLRVIELDFLMSWMSMLMCLMFLSRTPRGPVTLMIRDLMATVTPSGMVKSSVLRMSFI